MEHGDEPETETPRAERRDVCVWNEERRKKGDHTAACQKTPWRRRIHNRVRDRLAHGWTAPQWTTSTQDENGHPIFKLAQIDIVVTIPGRDELNMARRDDQTFDFIQTGSRSCFGCGICGRQGRQSKHDEMWKQEGDRSREGQASDLRNWGAGRGRRHLVTNLADAEQGGLNAAAQHTRLRAVIERNMVRAEADALIAASTHEECVLLRRTLKESEGDDEGEW